MTMLTDPLEERHAKKRGFWRKKVVLLGYLQAFHQAQSVDELFNSLRVLLQEEFQADDVFFSVADVRKRELVYYLPEYLRGRSVRIGEGCSGTAVAQGRSVYLTSSLDPLPFLPADGSSPSKAPVRSVLAAPLIRDGRAIGTVELLNRSESKDFSRADLEYLDALAPHMAIALNHFVLSEEARRRSEEEARLRVISRNINQSLFLNEILEEILESIKGLIPYDAAAIFLFANEDQEQELVVYGYFEEEIPILQARARVLEDQWLKEAGPAQLLSRTDELCLPSAIRPTTECEILLPLRSGERVIGVFSLANDQKDAYAQSDLELLEAFASQASLAIERARLHKSLVQKTQLDQELRIARDIQLRFLPREMPLISGMQIAALNVASRGVSGDYYDFIPIVEGQWGIVIGDVAGKGISAGLIMSAFRASLLAEIRNNFAISTILAKVNRLLWETTDENRFVTAFYGVYDEQQNILTYSNAGHNPPLLLRAAGNIERLATGGTILGAFRNSTYTEQRVTLCPGDIILFYTDGLTDSPIPGEEELGTEGVERLLTDHSHRTVEDIANFLVEHATRYSSSGFPEDDLTLVVIKIGGPQMEVAES
jgi:phosphoserine phosphatase RsbU/P